MLQASGFWYNGSIEKSVAFRGVRRKGQTIMDYDVIVAGAGMAGLTAAAYLCEQGHSVLVLEQADRVGGLVGSIEDDGFIFDFGIRSLENSGVLFPMLRQLGIEIEWIDSPVSLGVAGEMLDIRSEQSLAIYGDMLN